MSKTVKFLFVCAMVLSVSAVAMAQSTTTGAIGGVVTNPNKEVVAGASVSAVNTGTNKEETASTDDTGRFKITNLQPGIYKVTISSSGFSPYTQERVVVEVGLETKLEANLQVGEVTGTVEVTSEAPVINTSQQDFSTNINQTSINELPINGRRASSFVLLTPGAVPDGDFGLISFRGISGLLNNSTVDGGNNNQAFFAEEAGRTRISSSISQAAVREFQVNTSNYSAEYGRAAGGVVNTVTKSGTNEFHGSLFYYLRDNKLGARNPRGFNRGLPLKPVDRRHQFGGTIGGPIAKDKLFFFFSYDQQKREFPAIAQFSSATFLTTVNTSNLTAASRGITQAQINAATTFLDSLTGETPRRQDSYLLLPKIDWVINQSNTFTFTYNRLRNDSPGGVQTAATITRGRSSFGDDFVDIDYGIARLSSTITPNLINEFRTKIGVEDNYQFSTPPLPGEPTTGPGGRSPSVAITNGLTFGKPNFLERTHNPLEKNYQFVDNVTLTSGNHTFKWGGDYLRTNDVLDNLFQEGGVYSYNNINDFIVDYTNWTTSGALRTGGKVCSTSTRLAGTCYTSNYLQGFGQPRFEFNTTDLAYYLQDDWRWSPRLTVNLGLRYEIQLMPDPQIPNSLFPQTGQFPTDKNNFGPRGGFAYDITGDGKTSVRGGIGVYYGRLINSTISNAITNTGVDRGQVQFSIRPQDAPPPIFPNVLPTPASVANPTGAHVPGSNIVVLEPNLHWPMIIQGDFVFEREIARNTSVSASYLTSRGKFLPVFINENIAPATRFATLTVASGEFAGQTVTVPVFNARLNSNFNNITEVRGAVDSAYHALVLQANRRLTDGLQFQTNYTFSRAKDNGQSSVTFSSTNTPTDPYNLELDRGVANFNIPHRFVASAVWSPQWRADNDAVDAIFGGWTLAPIFTAQSGRPYSAEVSGSPSIGTPSALNSSITGSGGNSFFLPFGRNSFKQPRIVNLDARLSRRFRFTESANLEFLVEAFNVFNRTHITAVNNRLFSINSSNQLVPDPTFGTDSATGNSIFRERQVQWAFRFHF